MKIVFSYLICITLLIPSFSFSQEKVEKKIEITLDHNIKRERELATKEQLLRLLQKLRWTLQINLRLNSNVKIAQYSLEA